MRVLMDAAIAGWGHINPVERAGIYHATVNLLTALNQQLGPNELALYSTAWVAPWVRRFMASHPNLAQRPLLTNPGGWAVPGLQAGLPQNQGCNGQSLPLWCKATQLPWWAELVWGQDLVDKAFEGVTVFHSPIYPLPAHTPPGMKRVLTVHDVVWLELPSTCTAQTRWRMKATMASVRPDDTICTVSEFSKGRLVARLGWEADRIHVTPLAPSLHTIGEEAEWPELSRRLNLNDRFILTVGTLEPRKNLELLLSTFSLLCKQKSLADVKLVCVGAAGWKHTPVYDFLRNHPGMADRVVFTGYLPDAELAALYAHASVFAYPSLYEGFGLPLAEAMAAGLPIVSSNRTAMPEVLGEAGLQVSPTKLNDWVEALQLVLTDATEQDRLRGLSRQRAEHFSWEKTAWATLAAYQG
ncbi:MAG: glycosyltransferase family 4 protein [Cyanobacteria bacterium HKST-UBA03]|nr:glycosyltransferase family 4 protein [Cyanobacteria bacterium HKST-UBA03]